jgi:hypothetical protein
MCISIRWYTYLPCGLIMLQIGQSHPTGLTTNLLKLFEPRAPLEFRPPPEKRKCPPYQGMASVNFVLFWFIFAVWSWTSFPSLHEQETLYNGGSLLREHLCFYCYAAAYFFIAIGCLLIVVILLLPTCRHWAICEQLCRAWRSWICSTCHKRGDTGMKLLRWDVNLDFVMLEFVVMFSSMKLTPC